MLQQMISVNFTGARGNQFGRNTFVTMIPFHSLERFFKVFPEVQRTVTPKKVKGIADYILKGNSPHNYSFISALTVSCRGEIEYDENTKQVKIDINSVLSVNDGQHRLEGIKLALNEIKKKIEKATGEEKIKLSQEYNYFSNMTVPVVIYSNMNEDAEQQLFHDLNLLSTKPTRSVSLKFDKVDLYNRLAKELASENKYLNKLGIESEQAMLKKKSTKIMLLSTLRDTICYLISGSQKDTRQLLNEDNYESNKEMIDEILNELFNALPIDCNDRSKYILGFSGAFQGIAKYIHHLLNDESIINVTEYISGLGNIDWRHSAEIWTEFGGKFDASKNRVIFNGSSGGKNGIFKALLKYNKPASSAK
jgi:DGQHR domain-containing protein